MFPQALRVVDETHPQAVMLENVRGLLDPVFADYRQNIAKQLRAMGYWTDWHLFNAADFGVSQLRPRVICVAVREEIAPFSGGQHQVSNFPQQLESFCMI